MVSCLDYTNHFSAPDYWYLRGSDPKGMEPYVDWFSFMTYDLHGSWDANTPTLGNIIRPQTDIRDIQNDTLPTLVRLLRPCKGEFRSCILWQGLRSI